MAVVNLKSQVVTDMDASPTVKVGPTQLGGVIREAVGTDQTNSDDSTGSTFRMVRLPSRARVTKVLLSADGDPTAGAADVGLYLEDDGSVEDADFFASAQALTSALDDEDVTYESAVVAPEDRGKQLWEQLGESEDPNVMYDIALTLTADVDAATDLFLKVQYVVDE